MTDTYAVLIDRKHDFKEVSKLMIRRFSTEQYMRGFLDGYLFSEYKLFTLVELEIMANTNNQKLKDSWVMFVEVINLEDTDNEH